MKKIALIAIFFAAITHISLSFAQASQEIISIRVEKEPTIDGMADDKVWEHATQYTIQDKRLNVPIKLKTVHTNSMVFFLVAFPDKAENVLHKPWVWSKEFMSYTLGPQREDTFIFRWSMEDKEINLSNFSDDDFTSDLWYWKANRTNPSGFADDKIHILSSIRQKKSAQIVSETGKARYLLRLADKGKECYQQVVPIDFKGDIISQFKQVNPSGSRADVRAKGQWQDGSWHIEFARKLKTNNDDDINFDISSDKKYQFGISIKSLYGEPIDESQTHSNLYGQGRISEPLSLSFK